MFKLHLFYLAGGHKRRKVFSMLNDVKLQGRLTTNPELRNTKNDKEVVSFTLAVDRNGKDAGTDFIQLVAWDKTAEFLAQYCAKGQMIVVEANLRSRSTTDKDNKPQTVQEVVANQIYFCDSKTQKKKATEPSSSDEDSSDLPS